MNELYLAIKTALLALPEIKQVAIFNNQFTVMESDNNTENVLLMPAVLVEFSDFVYDTATKGLQTGSGTVRLYIGADYLITDELTIFNLRTVVHKAIQGLKDSDNGYSSLMRSGERQDTEHSNLIVWQMDYQVEITEESAYKEGSFVDARPVDFRIIF